MSSLLKSLSTGVCALALVSCASTPSTGGGKLSSKLDIAPGGQEPGTHDPIAKAAFWGTRYDREPNNAKVAVNFSEALRTMGSNEESLKVMSRIHRQFDQDAAVNLEYGKSLIANDRAFEAVRPLEVAITAGKGRDWKAYSAYGIAFDKIGEHKSARTQYDVALKLAPNSHTVLNNKGLSYALSGQLDKAELTLRYAAASSAGTATVRQNLALVLSFNGKTAEAERLARSDLPPRIAENNIGYFRSLVSQPAYWQEFTGDNVEMPSFDAPVETTGKVETAPVPDIPASAPPASIAPVQEPAVVDPAVGAEVLSSVSDEMVAPLAPPATDAFGENEWSWTAITGSAATGKPVQLQNTSTSDQDEADAPEVEVPAVDDVGA